jgi:hypothetical protein
LAYNGASDAGAATGSGVLLQQRHGAPEGGADVQASTAVGDYGVELVEVTGDEVEEREAATFCHVLSLAVGDATIKGEVMVTNDSLVALTPV